MAAGRQSSTGEEEEEVYNARCEIRVCAETCLLFDETGPSWQLLNGSNIGIDIINFLINQFQGLTSDRKSVV